MGNTSSANWRELQCQIRGKPAPIQQTLPRPDQAAFDGISVSKAESCGRCVMTVPQGVSSASATIYRDQGEVTLEECSRYETDIKKVLGEEMTLDEFKDNFRKRKYFVNLNNRCAQLTISDTVLESAKTVQEIIGSPERRVVAFRKLSAAGGMSSDTKLFIRPNIPFRIVFNGQAISVPVMTLFHPSPIRIENIQHDAVLTLGDVATSEIVVMIPLVGVSIPKEAGAFISKVTSYIPGILEPQPGTGLFPRIEVPTGNDWNLSKIFPAKPSGGENVVDVDYFVWNSTPPVERYQKSVINSGTACRPDTIVYGWRPLDRFGKKFIMLKKPVEISGFDLQSIKMLPATPSESFPVPFPDSLVYQPAGSCSTAPSGTTRETFTDSEKCDPLKNLPEKESVVNPDFLISLFSGFAYTLLIILGVYLALKYYPKVSEYVKIASDRIGLFLAGAGKQFEAAAAPMGRAISTMQAKQEQEKQAAERLEEAAKQEKPKLDKAVGSRSLSPVKKKSVKIGDKELSVGDKVVVNRTKHPKGYVTVGGRRCQKGGAEKCLGTPRYGDVGTITDIDLDDPSGLSVDIRCNEKDLNEMTGAWYRPDDLLPAPAPEPTKAPAEIRPATPVEPSAPAPEPTKAPAEIRPASPVEPSAPAPAEEVGLPKPSPKKTIGGINTIRDIEADVSRRYPVVGTSLRDNIVLDQYGEGFKNDELESINTSSYKNDCLIHSLLTSVSPSFRKLSKQNKDKYADDFRRRVLPTKYSEAEKSANKRLFDMLQPAVFLEDGHVQKLATTFGVNIFMFEKPLEGQGFLPVEFTSKGKTDPYIIMYNPGDGHFRSVRRIKDQKYLFTNAEGKELVQKYPGLGVEPSAPAPAPSTASAIPPAPEPTKAPAEIRPATPVEPLRSKSPAEIRPATPVEPSAISPAPKRKFSDRMRSLFNRSKKEKDPVKQEAIAKEIVEEQKQAAENLEDPVYEQKVVNETKELIAQFANYEGPRKAEIERKREQLILLLKNYERKQKSPPSSPEEKAAYEGAQSRLDSALKSSPPIKPKITEEQREAAKQAKERLEAMKRRPPPVQPAYQRPTALPVKEGTKQKTAEPRPFKPASPPAGPLDARLKSSLAAYKSPSPGRWMTKEERDLESARARARLSGQEYRQAKFGRGRRNRRKNIRHM